MTDPPDDCIGPGDFYRLGAPTDAPSQAEAGDCDRNEPANDIRINLETGEPYSVAALVSDLSNQDWYSRIRAAWALGRTGDVEAVLPLIQALVDPHRQVRDRALEAIRALEDGREPLPVRVLLCESIDDRQRTDTLLALTETHALRGMMWGTARAYCQLWLDEDGIELDADEQEVIAALKRAAAAVLKEIDCRSDAKLLVRAGARPEDESRNRLLRATQPGPTTQFHQELVLPDPGREEGASGGVDGDERGGKHRGADP